jgi:preprotein translocase subunit SecA
VSTLVETHCVSEYSEEWDVEGLATEARTFWPSTLSSEQIHVATSTNEVYEMLMDEALAHYEKRESELSPEIMRQVELQVMLRVIDQRWRAHLYEMDYLREGIGLRSMGQRDPLVEWQREGFDMFGQMMHGVWQDFIRYVMHVDVKINRPTPQDAPVDAAGDGANGRAAGGNGGAAARQDAPEDAALRNVQYSSPEDPATSGGAASMAAAARAGAASSGNGGSESAPAAQAPATNTPTVRSDWDKTPRNAPCPCGSGKKYKLCHGR